MHNPLRTPPNARARCSFALLVALALLLSACAPRLARPPEPLRGAPEGFPEADYRRLATQGRAVFSIDPARSLLVIEAHRSGSLARLGHDHVIAAHDLQGFIAPEARRSDLYFRLDALAVDEPELRAQAKLTTHPTADDIAGTQRNMLNAFEAERHPFAVIRIDEVSEADVRAAVLLHGVTRMQDVPVRIERSAEEITVTGELALRQTDFGIKPVSVLGGALQVEDEVAIRFSIRGQRMR